MINWAIRYQPVLEEIKRIRPSVVLEVGSGPEGLSLFWRGRVIGVDVEFKRRPLLLAVRASACALPFRDGSWPLVLSCDTLEHIPPPQRRLAIMEMARVSEKNLMVVFPSGQAAQDCYSALARRFKESLPPWLKEHVAYPLPEAAEVEGWLKADGWAVRTLWYESVEKHGRLAAWESYLPVQVATYALMRVAGRWLAPRWPVDYRGQLLRALLIAERSPGVVPGGS